MKMKLAYGVPDADLDRRGLDIPSGVSGHGDVTRLTSSERDIS